MKWPIRNMTAYSSTLNEYGIYACPVCKCLLCLEEGAPRCLQNLLRTHRSEGGGNERQNPSDARMHLRQNEGYDTYTLSML